MSEENKIIAKNILARKHRHDDIPAGPTPTARILGKHVCSRPKSFVTTRHTPYRGMMRHSDEVPVEPERKKTCFDRVEAGAATGGFIGGL